MPNSKFWYLKQLDLFKGIPDKEIMELASNVVERYCSKKEILYTPFENSSTVSILKKGEVTLYYSHMGKKLIIDVLKPGSIFGNINMSDKNTHFAEVTDDAYVCTFELEDFMKVIQAKPEIMLRFIQIIAKRLTEYENRLKGGLYDAKEKILHHLELLAEKRKSILGKFLAQRITHEKLAQHTGLSRETVTRAINALKKEGRIISTEEGAIAINPDYV